jgi:polyhydroxyalkanoate synthesis regulator phasin
VAAWSPASVRYRRYGVRIRSRETPLLLRERVDVLTARVADLHQQVLQLRLTISEAKLRTLVDAAMSARLQEISTLADHATKALRLLIDTGKITQEQANEAIR